MGYSLEGSDGRHAGSLTSSVPRPIWSRAMLSNRAVKFPSANLSSFVRWMKSKGAVIRDDRSKRCNMADDSAFAGFFQMREEPFDEASDIRVVKPRNVYPTVSGHVDAVLLT